MRLWQIIATTGLTIMLAATAQATLIAQEPFDYSDATLSTVDGINGGGSGFSGDWSTAPSSADVNLTGGSLVYPAGATLTATGGRVREVNGTLGGQAVRSISTVFDASTESTFYFSLLAKKRPASGSFFSVSLLDGTGAQFFSTGSGSGSSGVRIGRTSNTALNGGATEYFPNGAVGLLDNETYMFIGKVIFHAGATADEYYLSIYRTGVDTVPASEPAWTFNHTNDSAPATRLSGSTLAIVGGSMSGATADTNVDEIRFGTTYEDVAIPEPTALAMLSLCGLMVLKRGSVRRTQSSAGQSK